MAYANYREDEKTMPRPRKCRRVCRMPGCRRFGPLETQVMQSAISMTVDEFEAIRLIDLLGLTQEECAGHMAVARTTAQAIYNSARAKLAEVLVHGRELLISGGDIVLCEGVDRDCHRCCHRGQARPSGTEAGDTGEEEYKKSSCGTEQQEKGGYIL